ncbi:class I SAM-dependent methyltransferase [Gloeomargarita sp.]
MSLWAYFLDNQGETIHKCTHYFPIYEKMFQHWRNKSLVFLEIGVGKGGSLKMWQKYFGPNAKIVGIDVNPECKRYESPGIFVRIGDQGDQEFLASVVAEFGVPDIVLDDGSHKCIDIMRSFSFFYPLMGKNAVYMVEDLQTAYWEEYGGGLYHPDSFIEFVKKCIDSLNADSSRGQVKPDLITRQTFGIHIYDGIVCFEKGEVYWKDATMTGYSHHEPIVTNRFFYEKDT